MSARIKVAAVGSREYKDEEIIYAVLDKVYAVDPEMVLISGGAAGADTIAEQWANERRVVKEIIRPDYRNHPAKTAPLIRNAEIMDKADICIAFHDGCSRGTLNAIVHATKRLMPVWIVNKTGGCRCHTQTARWWESSGMLRLASIGIAVAGEK